MTAKNKFKMAVWPMVVWLLQPLSGWAHEDHVTPLEEIVVYGRAEQQLGIATAASSGQVGFRDVEFLPRLRVGELVESVPGMVATQHSGTGKANQFFLRGFNLDHGTDFSAHANGVPLNMRTHGHGQGYLDLNFLIPEMVAVTRYRKGPYHASVGDFSSAGTVEFEFFDQLNAPMLSATVGENDYLRALAAGSAALGSGVVTAAVDVTRNDGPWRLSEDLQQDKFMFAYTTSMGELRLRFDLQGYAGRWDATDQIPRRAVRAGLIDELGFLDADLGGSTDRYAATAMVAGPSWSLTAYVVDYDFSLFSNFTYFLDDPINGDELEQQDQRQIYGVNLLSETDLTVLDKNSRFRWGLQTRFDDIDGLGLYRTRARQRLQTVREDTVEEGSAGAFAELELDITDSLRVIAGVRGDYYHWDVDAGELANQGSGDDAIVSPKLSVAYRLNPSSEVYVNWGRGFHSNDVRGATITVDPVSRSPVEAVDALVDSDGAEIGYRFERSNQFNVALVGFWLELDSELVFVGDAGGTEATAGSQRVGLETSLFWQATNWLAIDANYTYTDASFTGEPGSADEIPGAVESTGSLGMNASWSNGLSASVRLRYLGRAPLIEDGSIESDPSLLVNAGIGYRFDNLDFRLEVFNLFDSNDQDISYFYASRLPGEPVDGVEDQHFHPLEPRSVRATVTWRYGQSD